MKLIKLISTKVRRRLDYECYADENFTDLFIVSRFIEAKAFCLFWVKINRYVIFLNEHNDPKGNEP